MYLAHFTGPEGTQTRLLAGFCGPKTERKTERRKRLSNPAFGSAFGAIWGGKTAKHGSKNGSENGSKQKSRKRSFWCSGRQSRSDGFAKAKVGFIRILVVRLWYGPPSAVGLTRPAPARGAGGLSIAKRHRRPVVFGSGRFVTDNFWNVFCRFLAFGSPVSEAPNSSKIESALPLWSAKW